MKKLLPKLFFSLLLTSLLLSIFGRIFVSSKLATTGGEVKNYESEIALLEKENSRLKEEIADISSLYRIKSEAQSLGMVYSPKI